LWVHYHDRLANVGKQINPSGSFPFNYIHLMYVTHTGVKVPLVYNLLNECVSAQSSTLATAPFQSGKTHLIDMLQSCH